MKASKLIEKLQKAIDKVGDADIRGIGYDDCLGGINLTRLRHVNITNEGDIVISETIGHTDAFIKFEEIK